MDTALAGKRLSELIASLIRDGQKAPGLHADKLTTVVKRLTKGLRFLDNVAYRLDRYMIAPEIPSGINDWEVVFRYLYALYRYLCFQEMNSAAKWQTERHSRLGSSFWPRIMEARAQVGKVLSVVDDISPSGALSPQTPEY